MDEKISCDLSLKTLQNSNAPRSALDLAKLFSGTNAIWTVLDSVSDSALPRGYTRNGRSLG